MNTKKSKYDHKKIEENWKKHWYDNNLYEAVDFSPKPKKYILAELPYPSGKTLHTGHMMRYTVPDIYSRYLRMQGYNVLFPMGWDCFGLPAETFAQKEGITPQEAIATAKINYKGAMNAMGYGFDWDREIDTSSPEYYKWTQWTFIKLWEKGLAEIKEMPVWYCEELGVLADEEVLSSDKSPSGKVSERGGYPVERKMKKQWVLKITDYADRLLADLDKVEYVDSVKNIQRNWIGRSEGAKIKWNINSHEIETFTTCPDTIYGVTFLAMAPEHPLAKELAKEATNTEDVLEYIQKSKGFSELERQTKEKTGVELKGISAKHPFNEVIASIPIFVADYILFDYGTGIVMGVPGHDERDFDFAQKLGIKIDTVIEGTPEKGKKVYTGDGMMINSFELNGMTNKSAKELVIERLTKENKGEKAVTYKIRDQVFSRQRYWGEPIPLIYKEDGSVEAVSPETLPVVLPEMKDFEPKDGNSPLARMTDWVKTTAQDGSSAQREVDTMPTWAGSNWYYMRYIDPHNDTCLADMEKLKYWMPVDKYFGDAGHNTAHLMYSRFWYKFLYDIGVAPEDEPYKYRMSGGILLGVDKRKMSKSRPEYVVNPSDVLRSYGADATRTYLAFIGPYEDTYPWSDTGIKSCYRLVRSIYELKDRVGTHKDTSKTDLNIALHRLIKNVTGMMENLKMNTAVSEIMIFVNSLKGTQQIPVNIWTDFLKVLAPFAPFTAEELWQETNGTSDTWANQHSIHLQQWPAFNEAWTQSDVITIAVQVNGKLRDTIEVDVEMDEESVKEKAQNLETVQKYLDGKKLQKIIYVPGKIVNLVVS